MNCYSLAFFCGGRIPQEPDAKQNPSFQPCDFDFLLQPLEV
jgi:hypothetical protein